MSDVGANANTVLKRVDEINRLAASLNDRKDVARLYRDATTLWMQVSEARIQVDAASRETVREALLAAERASAERFGRDAWARASLPQDE